MDNQALKTQPPYPTIGEVCRLFAGAFGTKSADPDARKKLNRLAREGDFDWHLPSQIIDSSILTPLESLDPDLAKFVGSYIDFLLNEHINLLSHVSLDALSREEAAPLLLKALGAGYVANFLIAFRDQVGGPDLGDFLRQETSPVDVVFSWAESTFGLRVASVAYPDNKQKRDDLSRWRRGETIPEFFGSILPLKRELEARLSDQKSDVLIFIKWLMVARALAWLSRESEKAGLGSLIAPVRQEILLNCPKRDVGLELSIANIKAGRRMGELLKRGLFLLHVSLTRTKPKKVGDQDAARKELEHFADLLNQIDIDGRAHYMLEWCKGRWHVLSGHTSDALPFYECATDQALYRAGENQRQILEEALSLAAQLGNKPTLKRLKHRALAMGLFSDLFAELPDVIADWETEQLAQAFPIMFPPNGYFPEASTTLPSKISLPLIAYDQASSDKLRPNLAKPNRVISIPTLDGGKLRRPQLIWFASENRTHEVRQLLDAGADVNISDAQGGSAILNALQCANDGRGRHALDLLLKHPHDKNTLDRLTSKKRLSPLYLAVLLGDPQVVDRLMKMGASADLPASYPPQTPLYICMERFALYRQGWAEEFFLQRLHSPQPEDPEIHRRYSGGFAGAFGDKPSPLSNMTAPIEAEMRRQISMIFAQKQAEIPRTNYLHIAEILLEHEADPNRRHSSPGPGRTPLMVAAENNAVDAFRILIDAGGDPRIKDDQGHDCHVIARAFGSSDVLEFLGN